MLRFPKALDLSTPSLRAYAELKPTSASLFFSLVDILLGKPVVQRRDTESSVALMARQCIVSLSLSSRVTLRAFTDPCFRLLSDFEPPTKARAVPRSIFLPWLNHLPRNFAPFAADDKLRFQEVSVQVDLFAFASLLA